MMTPFEKAKESLSISNEFLRICRNYYVLGAGDREELNVILNRTIDAEQSLQSLMMRYDQ